MEFKSDDEALAWMREAIEALRRAHERAAIAEMEASLSGPSEPAGAPMPGHCHPYYADRRGFILDWLNGLTNYGNYLNIPVTPVLRFTAIDEPLRPESMMPMTTLARHRAWWPAPYVGRPFIYVWEVGVDQYGRAVSGDVTDRVYVPEHRVRVKTGMAEFDGPQYRDSYYE